MINYMIEKIREFVKDKGKKEGGEFNFKVHHINKWRT